MAKDLAYKIGGPRHTLVLTTEELPAALRHAITLMLFSNDPEIRNFDGESVVRAFPKINTGGFSSIIFYLTKAAKRIAGYLAETDPDVTDVYFNGEESGDTLSITLNVETAKGTQSTVVYI